MGVEQREMSVGAYVLATYEEDSRGLDTVRVVSEEEFSEKGRDANTICLPCFVEVRLPEKLPEPDEIIKDGLPAPGIAAKYKEDFSKDADS